MNGRRTLRRRPLSLWFGLLLLLVARPAAAQTTPHPSDELLAKAARQGTLRAIVEMLPDGPSLPTREAIALRSSGPLRRGGPPLGASAQAERPQHLFVGWPD